MNTKIFSMSAIVVLAFLVIGGVLYVGAKKFQPKLDNEVKTEFSPILEVATMVRVMNPQPSEVVESSYAFRGEARGTWFFEASFPVRVEDAAGKILGRGIAQAEGEWMTEEFVPFRGSVEFLSDKDQQGRMVFEKDNPSGLPEHAGEFAIPVQLKKSDVTRFNVYFFNTITDPNVLYCDRGYPVERVVPKTQAVARAAVESLLVGPTDAEKEKGYVTVLNTEPRPVIQRLEIKNRIAYIDFDDAFNFQVGGSCRVQGIRAHVEQTLKQFSTVDSVVISVNGQTESILEP